MRWISGVKPFYILSLCLILLLEAVGVRLKAQANTYKKAGVQQPDTMLSFSLDSSITIKGKNGLFVQDFIDQIVGDTLFYAAFKKLKLYSFYAENDVITLDKKNKRTSHIYNKLYHNNDNSEYKQQYIESLDSGEVFKRNGKYRLFTVQMFSYMFQNMKSSDYIDQPVSKDRKKEESYKDKLKTLIFNPGKPVKGLPFIGSKTEIFNPDMRERYDYRFFSGMYKDSIPVYRFKCTVKPSYANSTMINQLVTIFDKRNFNILGRYIDMRYDNIFFNFNVKMNIEMNYINGDILPVYITYSGNWKIPFKKEETALIKIKHYGFTPGYKKF